MLSLVQNGPYTVYLFSAPIWRPVILKMVTGHKNCPGAEKGMPSEHIIETILSLLQHGPYAMCSDFLYSVRSYQTWLPDTKTAREPRKG